MASHRLTLIAGLCAGLFALVACATDPALERSEGTSDAETSTVQSSFGKVEIPVEPQAAMGCTPRTSTS